MLDLKGEGWYGFVVNREHLFLRNIYTPFELKEMNIETIESALDDGDVSDEIKNFLVEDLMIAIQHYLNLRMIFIT